MKIKLGELRRICQEAKVAASPDYMRKERVRERLQQVVVDMVAHGELKDANELDGFFAAADASLKALKMIPLDVWNKLALKKH